MTYNLSHRFADEVFVPWAAIENNLEFITDKDITLATADFVDARIASRREIHILSNEASQIVWRLYQMSVIDFLKRWYAKCPEMTSMGFMYLKLAIPDETTTAPVVPAEDN